MMVIMMDDNYDECDVNNGAADDKMLLMKVM